MSYIHVTLTEVGVMWFLFLTIRPKALRWVVTPTVLVLATSCTDGRVRTL